MLVDARSLRRYKSPAAGRRVRIENADADA
jgi:hypothetical protein